MRNICVITGTRADYGLLSGIMYAIKSSDEFELQIIASCMHLSEDFGLTYKEIERDGYIINEKIDMLLPGNSTLSVSKSIGKGVIAFADAYERLKPDLIIILGDRFEALSAAQTAMIANIPIAHIHGGEVTEGAIDESIRHAITKMSNLHFVSTLEFKKRVIQLGEQPDRIVVSGAPGLDNIKNMQKISKKKCENILNYKFLKRNFLITYHPETIQSSAEVCIDNLLIALNHFPDAGIIFTGPNADVGGNLIMEKLKNYASENSPRVTFFNSLGYDKYLKTLQHIDCVIGNSSSGLIEAPSFKIPTINIGDRQKGRIRASSVIDCDETVDGIIAGIREGLSDTFKYKLRHNINPYGDGNAAKIIMQTIKEIKFNKLLRKPFYDIMIGAVD